MTLKVSGQMTRLVVTATKRRRGDMRRGMVAFRKVSWLADTQKFALRIAATLAAFGWDVVAIREATLEA